MCFPVVSGRGSPHLPIPGITVMVFRARSTRKVLKAEMFPKSTNSVTYLSGELRWSVSDRAGTEIKCLWVQNDYHKEKRVGIS